MLKLILLICLIVVAIVSIVKFEIALFKFLFVVCVLAIIGIFIFL